MVDHRRFLSTRSPADSWRVKRFRRFFEKPSIYKTDERVKKYMFREQFRRIRQIFSLDSIWFCCLASAVAVSGNGFAVQHRHFLDSIGVCRLASAFAIQETVLLSSIGVSCPASSTPISKPTTTYMLCTTGRQHQITSGGNRVDPRHGLRFSGPWRNQRRLHRLE